MESLIVIAAYALTLVLVVWPPKVLAVADPDDVGGPDRPRPPFWRNVRFWASVVIVVQIAVYATWG